MGLLATVLDMPIILPPQPSAAVVLGAAMLGRFAHQLAVARQGQPITNQHDALESQKLSNGGKGLWDVMVDMTQQGQRVDPRPGPQGQQEKRLLDVKYKIFREAVEVQKKWRAMIAEVEK